jgi:hypothetical protein
MKLLILTALLFVCGCTSKQNECIINEKYVKRHIWNEDNPFEKPTYDTVVVVDIQSEWVKYRSLNNEDTTFFQSTRVKYFLEDCKPLNTTTK